jgi:phosphate-selective porin
MPELSGYIQPALDWNLSGDDAQLRFFVRRLRVKLQGKVLGERVGYSVMFDFAALQRPLRDGYIKIGLVPDQELRIGQFKVPFGWENWLSSTLLPTIERAVVSDRLARGPDLRDIGLGVFGSVKLAGDWKLTDGLAVVNGAGANNPESTPRKDVFARLGVAHGKIFAAGVSGATVQFIEGTGTAAAQMSSVRFGVDAMVDYGPFLFVAEAIRGRTRQPVRSSPFGFYATGLVRGPMGLQGVARYERFNPRIVDTPLQERLTLGANLLSDNSKLKLMLNYRVDLRGEDDLLLAQTQVLF